MPARSLKPRSTVARKLRADSTDAEHILWRALRERLPLDKFRSQTRSASALRISRARRGSSSSSSTASQHADELAADEKRSAELAANGYRVIRFWNNDVTQNPGVVLDTIYRELEAPHLTLPSPPRRGGEGNS